MTARDRHAGPVPLLFAAAAAVGAGASALLLYEYLRPVMLFCGVGGGCDQVRASAFGYIGPIPMPALGLAFFGAALALSLIPRASARRWLLPLALSGGVAALGLIALQAFVIRAWCPYCVVADVSALAMAALAVPLRAQAPDAPHRWAVAVPVVLAALAATPSVAVLRAPNPLATTDNVVPQATVPDVIAREQRDGIATIVEFVDFQCPYCRRQHLSMKDVLAGYGDRVRIVYKHVPLPSHPDAKTAARAACCAEEQGKGAEMASSLLEADDLGAEGCAELARSLGLDMDAYEACLASDRPDQRIRSDGEDARALGLRGLPTFYIGDLRLEGLHDDEVVRAAVERALARRR